VEDHFEGPAYIYDVVGHPDLQPYINIEPDGRYRAVMMDDEQTFDDIVLAERALSNFYANEELGDKRATRYTSYALPGGENYRELLLTLPTREPATSPIPAVGDNGLPAGWSVEPFEDSAGAKSWSILNAEREPVIDYMPERVTTEAQARQYAAEWYADNARRDNLPAPRNPAVFQSGHWDEPNIIAHVRFNERTDAEGKRVLFIEEIQSDWAQKGRKRGFIEAPLTDAERARFSELQAKRNNGGSRAMAPGEDEERRALQERAKEAAERAPRGPFVERTDAWVSLALKRMIRWAADNGFDRVAFVTGEQSAERYDLSKHIKSLTLHDNTSGGIGRPRMEGAFNGGVLTAMGHNGRAVFDGASVRSTEHLTEMIGKDAAKKLLNAPAREGRYAGLGARERSLEGLDLKVGGEGMKSFYDQIVPKVANDVLKKLGGGRVSIVRIEAGESGKWGVYDATDEDNQGLLQSFDTKGDADAFADEQDGGVDVRRVPKYGEQPGFDITPELRARARAGVPLFSRAGQRDVSMTRDESVRAAETAVTTAIPDWARAFAPAQQGALRKAGVIFEHQTLKDRGRNLTRDFGKKFIQCVVDQFAPLRELDQRAYMQARLSKATDGAIEALLLHGRPFLRDGALDVNAHDGGFLKVLQSLRDEHDRFFAWVAGQRAAELKKKGKENLLTDEDITFLATINRNDQSWPQREAAYGAALERLRSFSKAVMDIAEQQGLIDGQTRPLWESEFYVPFYRAMEDGAAGPTIKSGLVRQYAFKKLKGGTQNLNDLLKNTLMNWSHLLSAAQKNAASKAAIDAAVRVGIATAVEPDTKGAVWYLDRGEKKHFLIEDPYVMDAITALEAAAFGPWMKPLAAFKRWLTFGVTANPAFKIRNLIRDSLAAVGQNELSYNVFENIVTGWRETNDSQTRASLMAGGGMFRFGTMLEGDRAQHLKRLVQNGVDEGTVLDSKAKVAAFFTKAWDAYQEIGDRSENINRAALYTKLRAQGMDHLEASYRARDMLDFSMQGRWAAVRFLTTTVPFLNARLQGLYKLGRAAKENPVRIGYVAAAIVLASLALMLGYEDDDDWKKREDWDRDSYWWFKFGGIAYRIPKPFELGALGTIAERTYELAFNNEMTGKRFRQRMSDIVSQNFSMSPVPQLFKPLVDVYANQDSFTGRTIETFAMERLRKQDRYTGHTTYAARFLGQLGLPDPLQLMQGRYEGLSPAQTDYLIRGYFGWLGTMATSALDFGVRATTDAPAKPAMRLNDTFLAGNFVESLPSNQSRYVTELYEQAKEVEAAYGSWRQALKMGDRDQAAEILDDEREKIKKYAAVERVKRAEAALAARAKLVESSRTLTAEQKREQLDAIDRRKDELARRITAVPAVTP
jgi:hypothetical protein